MLAAEEFEFGHSIRNSGLRAGGVSTIKNGSRTPYVSTSSEGKFDSVNSWPAIRCRLGRTIRPQFVFHRGGESPNFLSLFLPGHPGWALPRLPISHPAKQTPNHLLAYPRLRAHAKPGQNLTGFHETKPNTSHCESWHQEPIVLCVSRKDHSLPRSFRLKKISPPL